MEHFDESAEMGIEEKLMSALGNLLALLEQEREALLSGDARRVSSLATEKERVAAALPTTSGGAEPVRRSDLLLLAKRVGDLATSNHVLIEQMYKHYNGMLELILRLAGQSQTYGPSGSMNDVGRLNARSSRIIA